MMNKVTYLFGAGASCNALPVINQIPDRLNGLICILQGIEFELSSSETFTNVKINKSKNDLQKELIEDLQWLLEECRKHASVDTLAKKLYVKGNFNKLNLLKICLSIFFICEQLQNKVDSRYDSFYAALLNNNINSLPTHVKIMSWNYDFQFEQAFSDYSDRPEISTNQAFLGVLEKYGNDTPNDSNGFNLIKLNGTSSLKNGGYRNSYFLSTLEIGLTIQKLEILVKNYALCKYFSDSVYPTLSFAWEEEHRDKNIIKTAMDLTKDTNILIVIGYSFPFFNRTIDRKIVENMSNLKKVYFQSPEAKNLIERFYSVKNDMTGIELVARFDTEQFLLPNEL